uniref:Protein kinase domain-containing protein n=1 Tax=Syphacia muris TaxID=451379 RepID=A0A158R655_9BILA
MTDGEGDEARLRQDDELLVLQSIFGSDVINLGDTKCWKMWRPFDVIIHLHPSYSGDSKNSFVSIDLHVKCKEDYPVKSSPEILLENSKGLSNDDVKRLGNMLKKKSNELLGSEVVLELCQIIQEFLSENNKPPEGSFHDGMLRQKAAEQYKIKQQKDRFEQQERDEIAAFEDMRRDKLLWKQAEDYERLMVNNRTSFLSSEVFTCINDMKQIRICFTNIGDERKLPSNNVFCRRSTAFDFDTNNELLVTEWKFVYSLGRKGVCRKNLFSTALFVEKIEQLENQMLRLTKWKPQSQNLCPYNFFCIQKNSILPSNVDVRIVYGQNLKSEEVSLDACLERIICKPKLLLKLANNMISALKCLHAEQRLHSNLKAETIWPAITDLCEAFERGTGKQLSKSVSSISRTDDIFSLRDLFQSFFLRFTEDNVKTWLKNFIDLLSSANSSTCTSAIFDDRRMSVNNPNGRLKNEFVYLEFLGKGGFGDVILARNKLDGNDYAIKRIPLDPKDDKLNKKVMREAKLFSRLCHPNVVRYFSAWIENVFHASPSSAQSNSETNGHLNTDQQPLDESLMPTHLRNIESRAVDVPLESTAEWTTSFRQASEASSSSGSSLNAGDLRLPNDMYRLNAVSNTTNSDFEVLFEENDRLVEGSEKESTDSSEHSLECDTEDLKDLGFRVLYIQMEYCERSTLRSVIDNEKLSTSPRRIWQILKEILLGLQYIHQQGMIHRDIKPVRINF